MSPHNTPSISETLYGPTLAHHQGGEETASVPQSLLLESAHDLGCTVATLAAQLHAWREHPHSYRLPEPLPTSLENTTTVGAVTSTPRAQRSLTKLRYERWLTQPHPIFVYGTLKRGEYNHHVLEEHLHAPALLSGYQLHHLPFGYPTVSPTSDPNSHVWGELFQPLGEPGEQGGIATRCLLQSLDSLEGFDHDHPQSNFYERTLVHVTPVDSDGSHGEPLEAWTYRAGEAVFEYLTSDRLVPAGIWTG